MVKKHFNSTISSKGQVTVPAEVRHRLGLREGDQIEFVLDGGHTVIRPAQSRANPFEKYIGILPAFENRHQINEWVADMREEDERD